MQRDLFSSADFSLDRGHRHGSSEPVNPMSTSRERVRSLPILVKRQDGWHLDWIDVVDGSSRPERRLTARAQGHLEEDGQ